MSIEKELKNLTLTSEDRQSYRRDELALEPNDKITCNKANDDRKSPYKIANKQKHALSDLQKKSDKFEHLGVTWAAKLRKMQPTQSKLAEKLISEVLLQGDNQKLSLDTTVERKTSKITSQSLTSNKPSSDGQFRSIKKPKTSINKPKPSIKNSDTKTNSDPYAPSYVSWRESGETHYITYEEAWGCEEPDPIYIDFEKEFGLEEPIYIDYEAEFGYDKF